MFCRARNDIWSSVYDVHSVIFQSSVYNCKEIRLISDCIGFRYLLKFNRFDTIFYIKIMFRTRMKKGHRRTLVNCSIWNAIKINYLRWIKWLRLEMQGTIPVNFKLLNIFIRKRLWIRECIYVNKMLKRTLNELHLKGRLILSVLLYPNLLIYGQYKHYTCTMNIMILPGTNWKRFYLMDLVNNSSKYRIEIMTYLIFV